MNEFQGEVNEEIDEDSKVIQHRLSTDYFIKFLNIEYALNNLIL